jgi:streptothricin hydrolase
MRVSSLRPNSRGDVYRANDGTTAGPCEDAAVATALLLVDVQRNMLEGSTPVPAAGQVRLALESLLARARTAGALVVHIQNDGPEGSPDEPDTEGWELVFPPVPGELAVRKAGPDVFIADACLASALTARGVDRVVVAGMQSNYCIAQTSRGALRHQFTVLLASGAHATYDEQDSAAVISGSVETALSRDGIAVVPAAEITFPG